MDREVLRRLALEALLAAHTSEFWRLANAVPDLPRTAEYRAPSTPQG